MMLSFVWLGRDSQRIAPMVAGIQWLNALFFLAYTPSSSLRHALFTRAGCHKTAGVRWLWQ